MKFKKLTPNLMVRDVRESVDFYTNYLGFRLDMAVPENSKDMHDKLKDGKRYGYAMVSRDDAYIMFMKKEAFEEDIPMLKNTPVGASASFYFDLDDVEELYDSLKKTVDIAIDLHTTWYGMKEFYIKDCNGYVLCFASRT